MKLHRVAPFWPRARSVLAHACALAALTCAVRAAPRQESSAPPSQVTLLRLFDGDTLWGSIVGHDAQTLHVQRLDNGGKVRLPWTKLDPSLADELLEKYGYVDHSGDEVIIEADRLMLTDGSELVGIIVNRGQSELWIKTAQSTQPVPMLRVRGASTRVQVPALDVYTRDELYQQELSKLDANSAQSLWELSIYCERIYDFTHAVEHLQAAAALDPAFKPNEIATAVARNKIKVANQAQLDALREIDYDRVRGYFDRALQKIAAFQAAYPTSGYLQDAAKKKVAVEKARDAKLRERVVEYWHSWIGRLLETKTRDPQLTLEAAMSWVEEGLSKELLDAVAKDVQRAVSAEATPDLISRYWKERAPGRWRKASYGQGTFLLGDAEARKGLAPEEEEANKPQSETDNARKQLEERIARYLQNQEMVRKAKQSGEDDDGIEKFWREYSSFSKSQWLLAYYVEHSGDFQLGKPLFSNCPDCGGTGKREILNAVGKQNQGGNRGGSGPSGPNTQLVDCPMCHAIGVFRRVVYR
ncbi:MAG: hypothetical protein IT454_08270 [Planctomycetes bacterium]|nr:hypothetical protein [Planctomycetota bacterium]